MGGDQLGVLSARSPAFSAPPRDLFVLRGAEQLREQLVAPSRINACRNMNSSSPERLGGSMCRTSSFTRSRPSASRTFVQGSDPPSVATAPDQNTRPTTAASWSTAFSSAGRPSRRVAINPWIDRGSLDVRGRFSQPPRWRRWSRAGGTPSSSACERSPRRTAGCPSLRSHDQPVPGRPVMTAGQQVPDSIAETLVGRQRIQGRSRPRCACLRPTPAGSRTTRVARA